MLSVSPSNKHFEQQLCSYNQRTVTTQMSSSSSSFGLSSSSSQPSSTSSSPGTYDYVYTGFTGKKSAPQTIIPSRSQSQFHTSHSYPLSSTPPSINFSTHPKINKSFRQSSGELSDSSPIESPGSSQLLPPGMITLLEDLDMDDTVSPLKNRSRVAAHLVRTQSLSTGSAPVKQKRANTTSTCQPTHYLKVTHPEKGLQDEYVFMRPGQRPARQQVASKQGSKATITQSNYDFLKPLPATKSTSEDHTSTYENSPLPPDVATATPLLYQPSYENCNPAQLILETPQQHPVTEDDPSSADGATNINSAKHIKSGEIQSAWDELENLGHILENFINQ